MRFSRTVRLFLAASLWIGLFLPSSAPRSLSAASAALDPVQFVQGELLVRLHTPAKLQTGHLWQPGVQTPSSAPLALAVLTAPDDICGGTVAVPVGKELAVAQALKADPQVDRVEPNYLLHAASLPNTLAAADRSGTQNVTRAASVIPNDPLFPSQWALANIHAPEAWDVTTGISNVVVAVLDSGVDLSQPDLQGKIDAGINYVAHNTNPQDDNGHGTHTAGIIAAGTNNGLQIAGVSWGAHILPIKILRADGSGTYSDLCRAIRYATATNSKIINLSLAGPADSQIVHDAVAAASDAGTLMVAAAGNLGETGPTVGYPAAYPEVLAVAASDPTDQPATDYSAHGPRVDVAAPGGISSNQIVSLGLGGTTTTLYGTSQAAAVVSGVAALIWSVQPNLSAAQVRQVIMTTADQTGGLSYASGRNDYMGSGRVNALRAVQAVSPFVQNLAQVQFNTRQFNHPLTRTLWLQLNTGPFVRSPLDWQVQIVQNTLPSRLLSVSPVSGTLDASTSITQPLTVTLQPNGLPFGSYTSTLRLTTSLSTTQDIQVVFNYTPNASKIGVPSVLIP